MPPWRAPSGASRDLWLETLYYLFPVAMENLLHGPSCGATAEPGSPSRLLFPFLFYLCKGVGSHSCLCYANPGCPSRRTPFAGRGLWKGPVSPDITSHVFLVTCGSDMTHLKGEFRFPNPDPPLGVTTAVSLRGWSPQSCLPRIVSVGDACVPGGDFPEGLLPCQSAPVRASPAPRATGAGTLSAWKIGATGRRRGSSQLAGDPVSLRRGSCSLFLANGL